jgi:hypothetical protein
VLHHYVLLRTFVEHWEKFNTDPQLSAIDQRLTDLANKVTDGQESEASSSASRGTPTVKSPELTSSAIEKRYRNKKPAAPPPATPLQQRVTARIFDGPDSRLESEASGYIGTGNDMHESDINTSDDEQQLLKGKQKVASPAPAALHQDRAYHRAIRDDDDNDSDYEFLRLKPPIYVDVLDGPNQVGRKSTQDDLASSTSSNREYHPPSYAESCSRTSESDAYHALAQVLTKSMDQRENVCDLSLVRSYYSKATNQAMERTQERVEQTIYVPSRIFF